MGRELTGIEGAASGGLPWYGYAAGLAGVAVLGKVVTGVAANAIAEVEEEMKAKRAHQELRRGGEGAGSAPEFSLPEAKGAGGAVDEQQNLSNIL